MSIEVANPYGEAWRVYFSVDKGEPTDYYLGGEIVTMWDLCRWPDAEQRAHKFASRLRFMHGAYENVVNHFTTISDSPFHRACGCHEGPDFRWNIGDDCLYERWRAEDDAVAVGWAK